MVVWQPNLEVIKTECLRVFWMLFSLDNIWARVACLRYSLKRVRYTV